MRIQRIRKRDKPVTQVKKIVQQEISKSGVSRTIGVSTGGTFVSTGISDPGTTGTSGVRTTVYIDSAGDFETRAKIRPEGALYAVDDEAGDQIKLRHSALADPLFVLNM